MIKLSMITVLFLSGCSIPIVTKVNNPYDFPQSLLEECREPEFINPDLKLSENLKIMIENNTKSTECRITKKALTELIQKRKEIFDKSTK